jgi:signal transduction histidine kinase
MLLTAIVLASGGAVLMVRLVERPIASLTRVMARVEGGDVEARAELKTRDELGQLAESFNAMVERLEAAQTEIEVYHQQRLARAERLATLGELAASLAHEIKNPLAGISGAVQVLADDLPASDPRKEIMQEVLTQVRRLDKTVRDLLAFARPGKPSVAPCDIHQILDRVLLLLAENPAAKQVRVVRAYRPDIPQFPADGEQLRQVFLNLMLNALQAMPKGGCVTIATSRLHRGQLVKSSIGQRGRTQDPADSDELANGQLDHSTNRLAEGGWVEVAVADTGPGIPSHLLEEIFKPFFTTKHRGTGLGLSVSRRIIEDHGGWIEAESRPGQGATFRVFIPAAPRAGGDGERRP